MAVFKDLEPLGEEYYFMLMKQPDEPKNPWSLRRQKLGMWGFLFLSSFFGLMFPFLLEPELLDHVPLHLQIVNYLILGLIIFHFLFAVILSFGKTLAKHYVLQLFMRFYLILEFQLAFWNFVMCVATVSNDGDIFYFFLFLLLLLIAIGINIWVPFHAAKQLKAGAYKDGGGGFFGILDKPMGRRFADILKVYVPIVSGMITSLSIFSYGGRQLQRRMERWSGKPSSGPSSEFTLSVGAPLALSLLMLAMFCILAIGIYFLFTGLHMYKKFGFQHLYIDVEYDVAIKKDEQ